MQQGRYQEICFLQEANMQRRFSPSSRKMTCRHKCDRGTRSLSRPPKMNKNASPPNRENIMRREIGSPRHFPFSSNSTLVTANVEPISRSSFHFSPRLAPPSAPPPGLIGLTGTDNPPPPPPLSFPRRKQ